MTSSSAQAHAGKTPQPRRKRHCLISVTLLVTIFLHSQLAFGQFDQGRTVPGQSYMLSLQPFYMGEYRDALKGFQTATNSGINTGQGRWVDSICYFTMIGECLYHIGDLAGALEQYDAAMEIMIARRGWLKRLQFPAIIQPLTQFRTLPWGPSARRTVPGFFPDTMLSMQGTDLNQTLRQGGTVAPVELYPVRVMEIMRCTALALKRRREILGPIGPQISFTNQLVKELSRQLVTPNHWSQTLMNVQLGLAKAAAGDKDDAIALLQQSLQVGGRMDHPLTAIALLEIGNLAMEQGKLDVAQRSFLEATFPAVYFEQPDVLEEALRGAARIQSIKGAPGIYPVLVPAVQLAQQQRWDRVTAAALLASSENIALSGNVSQANGYLSQMRRTMNRTDLPRSDLGALAQYQTALLSYLSSRGSVGDKALRDSLRLLSPHSTHLFQLALTNQLYSAKEISPRVASILYLHLLREPTEADWQQRTAETLLWETTSHLKALQHWLETAIDGGQIETIIHVSEQIRRHKFFLEQPLGGRLLAMRWVLQAPDVLMTDDLRNQRQRLASRIPPWKDTAQKAAALKAQLNQLPVVPVSPEDKTSYLRTTKELVKVSENQEAMLKQLALRPDPASRMFPPLLSLDQLQTRLQPGQAVLALTVSGRTTHATLISADKQYKHWQLPQSPIKQSLVSLMRDIGNYDAKQVLPADRLTRTTWKKTATKLFEPLAAQLTKETLQDIQELIIVPDGSYWYLPFEMLQVTDNSSTKALIDIVRIRYAPSISLAVPDDRPDDTAGARVIVHGRLFSRETEATVSAAARDLNEQHPRSVVLRKSLPTTTRFLSPVWNQLIVFDDIESDDSAPLTWSPAQIDGKKPGGTLKDWLMLPWGAPDTIALPGFRTIAENGMRGRQQGDEMLLSSLSLMGAGTRTILLTRWRTGGQLSLEIVNEFLGGLNSQPPSTAWQRSVLLARSAELDPSREPRLKQVQAETVPTADHPFFWAGYILISSR